MGKKKKAKMTKGEYSVVSRGFDDVSKDEREDLLAYFDKLAMEVKKGNTDAISEMGKTLNIPDESVENTDFEDEISAFINGTNDRIEIAEPEKVEESIEVEVNLNYKEVVKPVEPEYVHSDDKELLYENEYHNDTEYEYLDEEDSYEPPVNYGLIMEDDNEILSVVSSFKNARSIDLYQMKQHYHKNDGVILDDEERGELFKNLKKIIIGMCYPEFFKRNYNSLKFMIDSLVNERILLPEDVYIRHIIGDDGKDYYGMFRFDNKGYDEAVEELLEYIDDTDISFSRIIIELISCINSISIKTIDVDRYFTETRKSANNEYTDAFMEYVITEGTRINSDISFDEYMRELENSGKYFSIDSLKKSCDVIMALLDKDETEEIKEPDIQEMVETVEAVDIIDVDDYDSVESEQVGATLMKDALGKFTASVKDDPEDDEHMFFTPKRKEGR